MAYLVDAQGNIFKDGVAIVKDITSKAYQDYLYFAQHGIDLSAPVATVEAKAETVVEKVESEFKKIEEDVVAFVKGL